MHQDSLTAIMEVAEDKGENVVQGLNVASDRTSFLLPKKTNHDSATATFTGRSLAGREISQMTLGSSRVLTLAVAGSFFLLGSRVDPN